MDFQKGGDKCPSCGLDKEEATSEIIRLQNSIFQMGRQCNLLNMSMEQVKNENLMLKQQLNQKNSNVQ